jgi:hypothetical protein
MMLIGNVAQTAMPCDVGTDPSIANVAMFENETMTVSWSVNHDGDHWVKVAKLSEEGDLETLSVEELTFYETYANDVPSGDFSLEGSLPGMYVVQYGWSNYRNCATLQLLSVLDYGESETFGTDVAATDIYADPNCVGYCTDFMHYCTQETIAFESFDECLEVCATYPADGEEGSASGNHLQCRAYHLHVEGGEILEHCPHAAWDGYNADHCAGTANGTDFVAGIILYVQVANQSNEYVNDLVATTLTDEGYTVLHVDAQHFETEEGYVVVVQFADSAESANTSTAEAAAVAQVFLDNPAQLESLLTSSDSSIVVTVSGADYEGDSSAADDLIDSLGGNGIAAAVLIPLTLLAVGLVVYLLGATCANAINDNLKFSAETLNLVNLVCQGLFVVMNLLVLASNHWADGTDATGAQAEYGLFYECLAGNCVPLIDGNTNEESVKIVAGAVFFAISALVVGVGIVGHAIRVKVDTNYTASNTTLKGVFYASLYNTAAYFIVFALYAAFYNDDLTGRSADIALSWAWALTFVLCLPLGVIGNVFTFRATQLSAAEAKDAATKNMPAQFDDLGIPNEDVEAGL